MPYSLLTEIKDASTFEASNSLSNRIIEACEGETKGDTAMALLVTTIGFFETEGFNAPREVAKIMLEMAAIQGDPDAIAVLSQHAADEALGELLDIVAGAATTEETAN